MLIVKNQALEKIISQVKKAERQEVCGLLAGQGQRVFGIYPMTNASETPENCYFMDPSEQLRAFKEIRALGQELVGIYHSHPFSAAYPSARDVELAFYPEAVYLIVSLYPAGRIYFRAFKIVAGQISEEEIYYEE